jgi:hypothetical protein
VSDRNGADPVEVSLATGMHTVTIYLREDGAQIDRIELEPADQNTCRIVFKEIRF